MINEGGYFMKTSMYTPVKNDELDFRETTYFFVYRHSEWKFRKDAQMMTKRQK